MNKNRFVVLASCAFGLALGFAPLFVSTMPILLKELSSGNGWSRTEASAGFAMTGLALAFATPFCGRLIDRFGARTVTVVSTLLLAALLFLFSLQSGSVVVFLALACAIGVCAVGATPISYLTILAKWFDDRLGTALGVAAIGIGVGYIGAPLLAAYLIQAAGWRGTYVGLALLALLPVINAYCFIREPQQSTASPIIGCEATGAVGGMTLREAMRTRAFWLLCGSVLLVATSVVGTWIHLAALISDRGYTLEAAARFASVGGASVLVARFAVGMLLDRFSTALIAALTFAGGAIGIFLLWLGGSGVTLTLAAVLMGMAMGAEGDIMPYACRRYFGLRAHGSTYGVVVAIFTFGGVVGPLLMAACFDRDGNYDAMLLVFAACCGLGALAALGLGHAKFGPEPSDQTAEPDQTVEPVQHSAVSERHSPVRVARWRSS